MSVTDTSTGQVDLTLRECPDVDTDDGRVLARVTVPAHLAGDLVALVERAIGFGHDLSYCQAEPPAPNDEPQRQEWNVATMDRRSTAETDHTEALASLQRLETTLRTAGDHVQASLVSEATERVERVDPEKLRHQ